MEPMDLEESSQYRLQCVRCKSFISYPFQLKSDTIVSKDEIKIPRYKGDNLNYHAQNDYNSGNKILYSFIYCLKCHEKVGYWMSMASIRLKDNINHIFCFRKCINMIKYEKKDVTEEEDRKFQQEEIFYNSQYLTDDVINYAKEHIDNFIKNVKLFEEQRNIIKLCHDGIERKIVTLKEFVVKAIKNEGKNDKYKLGIDFSKEEITQAQKRNRVRINKYEKEEVQKEEDSKSNGIKNNVQDNIEQNGQNIINEEIKNDNRNNQDGNGINKNGGESVEMNELSNNYKSDIYLDDKIKQKNNKEPSKNIQKNKKNKRKK